jgi:hypothetical protein
VIPLTLSNQNSQTIYVTAIQVGVQSTGVSGCNPNWFQINQVTIPSGSPVAVPSGGQVTLSGSNAPSIQMNDSGSNQDVCQRATLTLSYVGSGHS